MVHERIIGWLTITSNFICDAHNVCLRKLRRPIEIQELRYERLILAHLLFVPRLYRASQTFRHVGNETLVLAMLRPKISAV